MFETVGQARSGESGLSGAIAKAINALMHTNIEEVRRENLSLEFQEARRRLESSSKVDITVTHSGKFWKEFAIEQKLKLIII